MLNVVGAISIALFFALFLVMIALVIVALVSGVAFGGARRNAAALLAGGVFSVVTGGWYLYGQAASYYAKQDNVYLGNGLIGLLLLLGGVWMLSIGLAGVGLPRWMSALLALAGVAGIVPVYETLMLASTAGGLFAAYYALGALALLVAALVGLRRGDMLARAIGLGLAGAVVAIAAYIVVGMVTDASLAAYAQTGVDMALDAKPPVLEGFGLLACAVAGVVAYLLGRRDSSPAAVTPAAAATA